MSPSAENIAVDPQALPRTVITPPRAFSLDLRQAWASRELLYFFIWRDIKVRYKQTIIGAGWAIAQPLFTVLVFTLFFGRLAKVPSNGLPYPVMYFCAVLPWLYFANALNQATNTMIENQRVITKIYFPRIILPVSAVLSGLLDFGIGFVMLLAMMLFYGIAPGAAILALPLFLLLAIATALAVGLWLSAMNAIYRDVRYVMPFLTQLWMFASPVAYPASLVPEKWQWLYGLNPMAGVIEGFRWSLTGQGRPPDAMLLASSAVVLAIGVCGLLYFQKMESTIADVI